MASWTREELDQVASEIEVQASVAESGEVARLLIDAAQKLRLVMVATPRQEWQIGDMLQLDGSKYLITDIDDRDGEDDVRMMSLLHPCTYFDSTLYDLRNAIRLKLVPAEAK